MNQSSQNIFLNSYIYSSKNKNYSNKDKLINKTITEIENIIQEIKHEDINADKINLKFKNLKYLIFKIFNFLIIKTKVKKNQYLHIF